MSNIVTLKPARRSGSDADTRGGESAEILFFTGVRYVRLLDLDEEVVPGAEAIEAAGTTGADLIEAAERLLA